MDKNHQMDNTIELNDIVYAPLQTISTRNTSGKLGITEPTTIK